MEKSKLNMDEAVIAASFVFFLLISLHKLNYASLWFDEAVEYWYSKVMFGELPFFIEPTRFGGYPFGSSGMNMYQRIIVTYQPPLYNFLMHFWLKISDSAWWFRFFGVIMGLIGMAGIFKSVKVITKNNIVSAGAVFFSSCVFRLVYYWQECGEYCLMLGSLCWTIYFWICLIKEASKKNIICFTISAIIPVYSQYGAAFPVGVMILLALISVLLRKEKKSIIEITVSYAVAFVFTAIPLYFFFLKKQMIHQQGSSPLRSVSALFNSNIIRDLWENVLGVFQWSMTSFCSKESTVIALLIILIFSFAVMFKGGKDIQWLILINILTFFIYYFFVKVEIYSYGRFGNRYNLFFIPLWIITFFSIIFELYRIIENKKIKGWDLKSLYLGGLLCICVGYCFLSWTNGIQNNWQKDNNRDIVEQWYNHKAFKTNTIVYYGAGPGFAYYLCQNKQFAKSIEKNIIYMKWLKNKTEKEYMDYLKSIYGHKWPQKLFIAGTHIFKNDIEILIKQFTNNGYKRVNIYNNRGLLVRLVKD